MMMGSEMSTCRECERQWRASDVRMRGLRTGSWPGPDRGYAGSRPLVLAEIRTAPQERRPLLGSGGRPSGRSVGSQGLSPDGDGVCPCRAHGRQKGDMATAR